MNEDPTFRTPTQELDELTRQITEVKELLKDLQRHITAIEKHAKRAFGSPPSKKASTRGTNPRSPHEQPTLSAQDALAFFDSLVEKSREGSKQTARGDLNGLTSPDLALVATEVGITGLSKMGRKGIMQAILGRVQEAVMLSRNVNVTTPRR